MDSPYKGLRPYDPEDADRFFGREWESEITEANLMAARLTLFYGTSGVGKSSVLCAGVTDLLARRAARYRERRGTPGFALVFFDAWRDDPLDGLTRYYLNEITCARTFRVSALGDTEKAYQSDLESRFSHLKVMAEEWNVNGVIMLLVRYCDPFAYEMPSLKDYFDGLGIPSTYIEYDYTLGNLAPMRTRVEAFLETIA